MSSHPRNDDIADLPAKLQMTMGYIGQLDERVQIICGMIDEDIGKVTRIRARWVQKNGYRATNSKGPCGEAQGGSADLEKPVPGGWRTEEVVALQERINTCIDLVVRMSDEKWRLARNAYDRFDVSIRRLDADLRRMEADLRKQGLLPPDEEDAPPSRKRRRRRRRSAAAETERADDSEENGAGELGDGLRVVPNEPVYCICMQVSYGEMVGCDNLSCEHGEWFHFECVNVTQRPTGQWFCPGCTEQRKRARPESGLKSTTGHVSSAGSRAS